MIEAKRVGKRRDKEKGEHTSRSKRRAKHRTLEICFIRYQCVLHREEQLLKFVR